MTHYMLYGHGGACNHGAEAIIRTTVPLLRRTLDRPILLSTHFPEQDRAFGLDRLVDGLIPADLSRVPVEKAAGSWDEKTAAARQIYQHALDRIDRDTVCVAVGGDNYCYPNWHRQSLFHDAAKERGGRSILWCCSIEPGQIDTRMEAVLRGHDQIYARESLTQAALEQHGISQVTRLPDPAFFLTPEPVPLPNGFVPGGTAALNLSPLILRRSEKLLESFAETARFLLSRVRSLLLVSHVTMPADNDCDALGALEQCLSQGERERICRTPENLSAAQLKFLISRCELLVCCRTHASVAGYSTGVPTLVLGYSVKSRGIGADLSMERWVLPAEEGTFLPRLTAALWEERQAVRQKLLELRPRYLAPWDDLCRLRQTFENIR